MIRYRSPDIRNMLRASAVAVPMILVALSPSFAQNYPTTVATIGDSFADAIYLAMKARPDVLKKHHIKLIRWSRPIIGLARTDYFDYPGWLNESKKLADICVIQIGSNDMQALHDDGKYFAFGTDKWKELYLSRVKSMAGILTERRCRQIIWILQPGFERQKGMSEKHQVINVLQSEALQPSGSMVFEVTTSKEVYGGDNTHFNRNFILKLGDAILGLTAASKGLIQNHCFSCHNGFDAGSVSNPLNRRQGRFVRLKQTDAVLANAGETDDDKRPTAPPRPSPASHRRSAARQKMALRPSGRLNHFEGAPMRTAFVGRVGNPRPIGGAPWARPPRGLTAQQAGYQPAAQSSRAAAKRPVGAANLGCKPTLRPAGRDCASGNSRLESRLQAGLPAPQCLVVQSSRAAANLGSKPTFRLAGRDCTSGNSQLESRLQAGLPAPQFRGSSLVVQSSGDAAKRTAAD
jgi:hypothetical protein